MPEMSLVDIVNAFTGALLLPIYHLKRNQARFL
jgi:hypothetical protein